MLQMKSYIVVSALLLFPVAVCCQTLQVSYQGKQAVVSLSEMQHTDVQAKGQDGLSHISSCIPVSAILAKVQAPAGENLRGKGMSFVVIAGAKDGYHAALPWQSSTKGSAINPHSHATNRTANL